jgi:frataxin
MLNSLRRGLSASKLRTSLIRRNEWKTVRAMRPLPRFYSLSLQAGEYHRLADETMDRLTTELETLLEENDIPGSDVEYSVLYAASTSDMQTGVLTLKLGKHGTYVINKQPPNQQIWLSSPTRYKTPSLACISCANSSGPKRYDFENGDWVYQRDKSSMKALLEKELSRILSQDISLPILPDD